MRHTDLFVPFSPLYFCFSLLIQLLTESPPLNVFLSSKRQLDEQTIDISKVKRFNLTKSRRKNENNLNEFILLVRMKIGTAKLKRISFNQSPATGSMFRVMFRVNYHFCTLNLTNKEYLLSYKLICWIGP